MQWPPRRTPFMVRDRFEIKADLYPLPGTYNGQFESGHFAVDAEYDRELALKLDLLETHAERVRCIEPVHLERLADAQWRTLGLFAAEYPSLAREIAGGVVLPHYGVRLLAPTAAERICPLVVRDEPSPLGRRVADWLERQPGIARLVDAVALCCQEDLVIMQGTEPNRDLAESLHVCFPSGWDPREKLAGTFARIHQPVAESEKLVAAAPNVMKALLTKGPYLRFAWGVTLNPALDNHPETSRPAWNPRWDFDLDDLADHLYLRMERQTTFAMPEIERGLFTIRVYVDPLLERLERDPSLADRLHFMISHCSPAVLEYKGMARLAPPLLRWLESRAS